MAIFTLMKTVKTLIIMINKALYRTSLLLLLAVAFFSCEDTNGDNFKVDTERGWVQIDSSDEITGINNGSVVVEQANSRIHIPLKDDIRREALSIIMGRGI